MAIHFYLLIIRFTAFCPALTDRQTVRSGLPESGLPNQIRLELKKSITKEGMEMKSILIVSGEVYTDEPGVNNMIIKKLKEKYPQAELDILGNLYPDYNIDIQKEQEKLLKADIIVLQSPIYWYSISSLARRWIEQAFSYGWAYGTGGEALKGKTAILGLTAGGSAEDYSAGEKGVISEEELLKPLSLIFRYCHMNELKPVFTPSVYGAGSDDPAMKAYAEDLAQKHTDQIASQIDSVL